jgi:hypothetical protein
VREISVRQERKDVPGGFSIVAKRLARS